MDRKKRVFPSGSVMHVRRGSIAFVTMLVLSLGASTRTVVAQSGEDDSFSIPALKRLSLEELMNIDIAILGKRSLRLFDAPAAVSVISRDEIRRSGARSLPEVLRLSPILNVAQIDARQWAISSRGFNSTTSNKLLVLIDGRTVYTTLYSGVFWDVQDVLLEDVDRIEVITGPGGTLWGTNAVNGIINVITKSSQETQSQPFHVSAGAGITEKFSGALRYGGSLGGEWSYRAYLKYFDRGETEFEATGAGANDSWRSAQGGFRTDGVLSPTDALVFQGDVYIAEANQPVQPLATMEGGNILARWDHRIAEKSSLMLRSYVDYTNRRMPNVFGEDSRVFDVEMEHHVDWSEHAFSWGLGLRTGNSQAINSQILAFLPDDVSGSRFSGFVQDIVALAEELDLTLGTKLTKSTSSVLEVQPRISLGWSVNHDEFLWGAVTRAVRTPSRIDQDLYTPGMPPYILAGGPGFVSEKLIAFEAGYRNRMGEDFLIDLALFYNLYDDIRSVEPGPPYTVMNGLEATTYGGELVLNATLLEWWRVKCGYSHLQKMIVLKPWSMDASGGMGEGNDHKHRAVIQSSMDVIGTEVDIFFRFVDKLPNPGGYVPSYATVDCRFGWNPSENVEISVLFQNVFLSEHVEFGVPAGREQLGREVFGKIAVSL